MLPFPGAYARALHRPGVLAAFGTSMIGRFGYALVYLPLLLSVDAATRSLGAAGSAVALYGAGACFLAPVRAWLIDRAGPRWVLSSLSFAFAAALGAIAWWSASPSPSWALLAAAGVAGAVAPPLGPTMRVTWAVLLADPGERTAGVSLDSSVEELAYLAGPALAGVAIAAWHPRTVLAVAAGLVLLGTLSFAARPCLARSPHHPSRQPGERRSGRGSPTTLLAHRGSRWCSCPPSRPARSPG